MTQCDSPSQLHLNSLPGVVRRDSESEPQQPFTTNILINVKNNMLKSLGNSSS